MPIDPSFAVSGAEWQIGGVAPATPATTPAAGFGDALGSSLKALESTQQEAAQASRDLATGQATDATAVVMSVERAQLAMQLASQIRNKAVESAQEIFRTTV